MSAPGHQVAQAKPWGVNCPHWSALLPQGACAMGGHQLGGALGSFCRRVGGQWAQNSGGSAGKDTISTPPLHENSTDEGSEKADASSGSDSTSSSSEDSDSSNED